ncbi:MAG: ribonuclease D [Actinobacteria bacterium]|nr:ribonuclease D [Actinomycetota bacterium]
MTEEFIDHVTVAIPLLAPSDGTPPAITTESELEHAVATLASGSGPFAIDAERASGYKYSSRAYLIQIKRTGGGLHLIDPIPFASRAPEKVHPLFELLNKLINTDEVILHASTQDLPCLREVGILPSKLFDTELGARIAGLPRVGLGALVETLLGISLAKEHSSVDWSVRPLPLDWLNYAALDVELLIELRQKIAELLQAQGKLEWAAEEFEAILNSSAPEPRKDPWRRASGIHKVKNRNQLAIIKSIWLERDTLARHLDIAPGKLLSDSAIMELSLRRPEDRKEMEKALRPLGARARWFEHATNWLDAIQSGKATPESQWPPLRADGDSMPPVKIWREKFPHKFAPLSHARASLEKQAQALSIPLENLISPDLLRRICWMPPEGATQSLQVEAVRQALLERGARLWQATIIAPLLARALLEREPIQQPEIEKPPEIERQRDNSPSGV